MDLGNPDEPYRAYLDLKNQRAKTFVTLMSAKMLINIVDKALKGYQRTAIGFDSSVKVVSIFDYKTYFIQENSHGMIVIGKFKHGGTQYQHNNKDLIFRKNEVIGDQELRWSLVVIFNNLRVLFKSSNNLSTEYLTDFKSNSQERISVDGMLSIFSRLGRSLDS